MDKGLIYTIILILIIPFGIIFTGLYGVVPVFVSFIVIISGVLYLPKLIKKSLYEENGIIRVKNFRNFIYFLFVGSSYIAVNTAAFLYETGFNPLSDGIILMWSIVELVYIMNTIKMFYGTKKNYNPEMFIKMVRKEDKFSKRFLTIYIIAYIFIVGYITFK